MTAAECPTASELHPQLAAVVADDPAALLQAIRGIASGGKAGGAPCGLAACHLAAALGRRRCIVALLDAGERLLQLSAAMGGWERRPEDGWADRHVEVGKREPCRCRRHHSLDLSTSLPGADPCVWTEPPCGAGPYQPGDEEDYASYDQVTKSEVYRLLKNLLPTQAAFP